VAIVEIGVGLVLLVLLMVVFDLRILGGVLAAVGGSLASVILYAASLRSAGYSLKPVWDRGYLLAGLRMGVVLEVTYLLMILAQRLDLLLVYTLSDEASAGLYSVALTIGQIAAYAAGSLIAATFPRLANTPADRSAPLIFRSSRLCLAAATTSAVLLAAMIPWLIPFAFGDAFGGAVRPTLILLIGGTVWSEQWLLARAAAAKGRSLVSLGSLGATVASMLVLDALLIPAHGIVGAAIGSVIANVCGLIVGLWWFRREIGAGLTGLLPRPADYVELARFALRVAGRAKTLFRRS
jgi:O-antigen/teichoic acid export membrane protein